jgi:hypothetical protein
MDTSGRVPDPRLLAWMWRRLQADDRALLVESGGNGAQSSSLAALLVPLWGQAAGGEQRPLPAAAFEPGEDRRRWLLLGGPGSGKSTLGTAITQLDRLNWLASPGTDREEEATLTRMHALRTRLNVGEGSRRVPIRVPLPELLRWTREGRDGLWGWVAAQLAGPAEPVLPEGEARELIRAHGPVRWVLDALDELPGNQRKSTLDEALAAIGGQDDVIVTCRPQAYGDECAGFLLTSPRC